MNTQEMIKALESQGFKIKKPTKREWWIEFRTDGITNVYDESTKAVAGGSPNTIEIVHVVERKTRRRRKKSETKEATGSNEP